METDVKAQIMTAALNLFAEKGFAKTSMNDIVRAAGLSKGGVYWHFPSKDALVQAIFDQFFEGQLAALGDLIQRSDLTAREKLMGLARQGSAELAALTGQFPSSMEFYALAINDAMLRQTLIQYLDRYQTMIEELVVQGISAGEWRRMDAHVTANTLIAVIEGVLLIWALKPGAFLLTEQLEGSIALFLEGLSRHTGSG